MKPKINGNKPQRQKIIFYLCLQILNVVIAEEKKRCCSNILLESDQEVHKIQGERLGFYRQLGFYGARPAYRQEGGQYFLFYYEDEQKWVDSRYFYGATLFSKLENDMDGYCLDEWDNWSFFNRSSFKFSESLMTNCSKIEDVCCHEIRISSANSDLKFGDKPFYDEQPKESLGIYKSIGMVNGRYVYQKDNHDRFLEYGEKYWLVSTGVGKGSGHIHHPGGSVCPEHIKNEWQIAHKNEDDEWAWKDDPKLEITCIKQKADKKPNHHTEVHHTAGALAQRYIEIEHIGHHASYGTTAIVFGFITLILLSVMVLYFGRRFHKSWGRGAQGKQLLLQTLDLQ